MTYPVARMRSITSRILRRYALWVGSDRPTPRGSAIVSEKVCPSPIDEMPDVVGKELIDETGDVLLRWGSGKSDLPGSNQVRFIDMWVKMELEGKMRRYR